MYSYFSRDGDGNVLYTTHHFSVVELEEMLIEVGFLSLCMRYERQAVVDPRKLQTFYMLQHGEQVNVNV